MPKRFPLTILLLALLAGGAGDAALSSGSDEAGPSKVFILAGDESMLGRALPLNAGEGSDSRLLVWRNGAWQVAADPLDPSDSRNGIGPGMTFGLHVLADDPSGDVGLIMCARAGSSMRDWKTTKQIRQCTDAVKAAGAQVAGVVFFQGVSDASSRKQAGGWASGFRTMVTTFRSSVGAYVPFVVGQLQNLKASYQWASSVRDQQARISGDPGVALVPTLDLAVSADGSSLTLDSNKALGGRFEDAWHAESATWRPPTELFVLAGQSNMVGRGKPISDGTKNTDPSLLVLRHGVWQVATDPLGPLEDGDSAVGPGMTFALRVHQDEPSATVGIIMCAVGGTSITQWQPGGALYSNCVSQAEAEHAPVAGILFLQGESDSQTTTAANAWKGLFEQMLVGFRNDLGPGVPFVLGQIGHIEPAGYPYAAIVRNEQAEAATENPGVSLVVTSDLPMNKVHFTVPSYKTIGDRFGDAWWQLASG